MWYAHLEGKLLKLDDKRKIKIGCFMSVASLYAMAMAFYVMNWRSGPNSILLDAHVKNISIYMLKAPFLENQYIHKYNVDHILELQGWSLKEPEIVPSVNKITKARTSGVFVQFKCNYNSTFIPFECEPTNPNPNLNLLFFFLYSPKSAGGPYGEVKYSLARLRDVDSEREFCVSTGKDLQDGWRLWYFNTLKEQHREAQPRIFINNPWDQACTVPKPWYDAELKICQLYKDFIEGGGILDKARHADEDKVMGM